MFILKVFRIFVSEIYEVCDATFLDRATSSDKNDKWYNQNSAFEITKNSDSKTVNLPQQSSMMALFANGGNTWASSLIFEPPFAFEVDIELLVTGLQLEVRGNSFTTCGLNSSGHYKIVVTGTTVEKWLNGSLIEPISQREITGLNAIGFRGQIGKIKYSNFVIYPIG